jgi:putative endonuclease
MARGNRQYLRKRRKGAFWEDRYHATAIETGRHLVQCLVYIDLYPVKWLEKEMFYYTYVLQSERDGNFYRGYTKNLKLRFEQHKKGLAESPRDKRPRKLLYYEACLDQNDATKREKYLKTYHACPVKWFWL